MSMPVAIEDTPIPVILVLNHGKIPCHGLPSDRVLEDMESWIEEHRVCFSYACEGLSAALQLISLPHIYHCYISYINISLLHPRWDKQCRDTMLTVPPQLTSSLPSFSCPTSFRHPPPASSLHYNLKH